MFPPTLRGRRVVALAGAQAFLGAVIRQMLILPVHQRVENRTQHVALTVRLEGFLCVHPKTIRI